MSVLQVFRPLPVARAVCRAETLPASAATYARDVITLGWEDRLKARGRRQSDGGLEFGTALPRGLLLRQGDCFVLDSVQVVVEVAERDEPVLIVSPGAGAEWATFGYHIGNSHQPVMITATAIICPDVPGMAQVLDQHAIPFAHAIQPFNPIGAFVDHVH
jgi:urease accessory protein